MASYVPGSKLLNKVRLSLKMLGFWETFKGIVHYLTKPEKLGEGLKFDKKYGTDTNTHVKVHDLGIEDEKQADAIFYYPLKPKILKFIIKSLKIKYSEFTFIDIGSGKGRNLLLTSFFPFQRRIGVEISPNLHEIAKRNLDIWRSQSTGDMNMELRNENALDFDFPKENCVILMYHPFKAKVTREFLKNIESSIKGNPRRILLIIISRSTNDQRWVFEGSKFFELKVDFEVMHLDWSWCLYENILKEAARS